MSVRRIITWLSPSEVAIGKSTEITTRQRDHKILEFINFPNVAPTINVFTAERIGTSTFAISPAVFNDDY